MKKLVVVGAGRIGLIAMKTLGISRVAFFADNSIEKQKKGYEGKCVLPIDTLSKIKDNYIFIIAIEQYQEVEKQLIELGVNNYINFVNPDKSSVLIDNIPLNTLYTPTSLIKTEKYYFIVDCWHHRIIYNEKLSESVDKWKIMVSNLQNPHSIAYDGSNYIIDNTDMKEVLVFSEENGVFVIKKIIKVEGKPHRIIYDKKRDVFWAVLYETSDIILIQKRDGNFITKTCNIQGGFPNDINNMVYSRSIQIIEDRIYLATSIGKIYQLKLDNLDLTVEKIFCMPKGMYGLNDVFLFKGKWFVSSYTDEDGYLTPRLIVGHSLKQIESGKYKDLTNVFRGIPYYMQCVEGSLVITEIDLVSGLLAIDVDLDKDEIEISRLMTQIFLPNDGDFYMRYKVEHDIIIGENTNGNDWKCKN